MTSYLYDLHVHTRESSGCGRLGASRVAELYKEAGYTGIVITDHWLHGIIDFLRGRRWPDVVARLMRGYRKAAARGGEIGLEVFLGLELRFAGDRNDYLVYGVDERFLRDQPDLFRLGLEHLHALARENGFLVFQAHPFRPGSEPADPALLDGVEVQNGNPRHDSRNHLARDFAAAHRLLMSAGSDCHRHEDVGRGGIILRERVRSIGDLVRQLRESRKAAVELIGVEERG